MIVARAGVIAIASLLVLAGCSSPKEPAATSASAVGASPSASASAVTPSAAPTLDPAGTAAQNQPFFDQVTQALLASNKTPTGRQYVDALVTAGFDKKSMEVTPDKTAIGLVADAIEFSVKFGANCIVGQKGAEFGYTSVVVPTLDTGTCLVGKTRTIDW